MHPVTKDTLRSYDADAMAMAIKELKKTYSMHGRPGSASYEARKKWTDSLLTSTGPWSGTGAATAGSGSGKGGRGSGQFMKAFVPDSVEPGDVLELRGTGGKAVSVIVQSVDADADKEKLATGASLGASPEPEEY